jgi:hypothetical protein
VLTFGLWFLVDVIDLEYESFVELGCLRFKIFGMLLLGLSPEFEFVGDGGDAGIENLLVVADEF